MNKLLVAASLVALAGCASREHLGPHTGVAVRTALRTQVIHPEAGDDAKPIPGLDPQEAAVVSDAYFKSLGPEKGAATARKPNLLLIEEPEGPQKLPPPMGGPK